MRHYLGRVQQPAEDLALLLEHGGKRRIAAVLLDLADTGHRGSSLRLARRELSTPLRGEKRGRFHLAKLGYSEIGRHRNDDGERQKHHDSDSVHHLDSVRPSDSAGLEDLDTVEIAQAELAHKSLLPGHVGRTIAGKGSAAVREALTLRD